MNLNITATDLSCDEAKKIKISGSKSESNRLLILQALFSNIKINNLSNSDDTQVLQKALKPDEEIIDIHHAGTAMRFLTAYFAAQQGKEVLLTGSSRMQERPIAVLVEALRKLGADIAYENKEGFPPLRIKGKELSVSSVNLRANVSSQYISALLLIAPSLKNGLQLNLVGDITSIPYIKMTLSLLNQIGVKSLFKGNMIKVFPKKNEILEEHTLVVESDWSSASYFYSIIALSRLGTKVKLSSYKKNSLQGDAILADIYKQFGVKTVFNENEITIEKSNKVASSNLIRLDLSNSPDIAQTIAVTCFGLGMACDLSGLHTLKIKETDRLVALQTELTKLGGVVNITNDSLSLERSKEVNSDIKIGTYQDHRMAMAFAPIALKTNVIIEEADVVSKSYPDFWKDLKTINFETIQI